MSDTDYSESDEEPISIIGQGNTQDTSMFISDAVKKVKHWKAKYHKCAKEKAKNIQSVKDMNMRVVELLEIKRAYDQLKMDSDVEKRTLEMKLGNEAEQARKYQGLLKQSRTSLEDMVKKHQEIADTNKTNEAKLFQSKIECAGYVSSVASLEGQVAQLQDETHTNKDIAEQQANTIQFLSNERALLQKDSVLLKDKCKELSHQLNQFQNLCEDLDKKYASLTQEHQILKNNTDLSTATLTLNVNQSQKENLKLITERDTLKLNLSHSRENLEGTQQQLKELQETYRTEKSTAEENSVLLRQAEMSLQHLKEIYQEKESQLKSCTVGLEEQVASLKHQEELTRAELREAQAQRGGQTVSSTSTDQIATLNTEVGHLKATNQHHMEKIKQVVEEKGVEIERCNKVKQELEQLLVTRNNIEIELGKQRDAFKEEIKEMQNDKKNNENKHEVMKKKLDGARAELTRMEHELRNLQTNLSDKTTTGDHLSEEIGVLKADNNVLTHQLNQLKAASQEHQNQIENLKTRLTVLQEDNKNIRQKSEDISQKDKEKDVSYKELEATLAESKQKLHAQQIRNMEEVGKLKDELQERIFNLESETKQVRYERDSKEEQIRALRDQISRRMEEKVEEKTVVSGVVSEAGNSQQYRDLWEKYCAQETTIQKLRSDKIILDNSTTQLQYSLDTEREKVTATETAVKNTTDKLQDMRSKVGELQTQYNEGTNSIIRLEELVKIEQERNSRISAEYEEQHSIASKLTCTVSSQKDHISALKEEVKKKTAEKTALENEMGEKERMLSSEAKLRLHMTTQISSNSNTEAKVETERRKREKLEERCEEHLEQINRLKRILEDTETSKRKALEDLVEATKPQPTVSNIEDKVRALKQKLVGERENGKKEQEELTRKLKKFHNLAREEAASRKELTEKYIAVKTEIGELQGKVTVLLADNERLNKQYESLQADKSGLREEKLELENKIRSDYILKSESALSNKTLEAKNRVELNKKLHEMNCKLEQERKSREAIDTFKTATENKIREDMEKTNKELKEKVTEYYETLEQNERQLSNIQLENNKLKQILSQERLSTERLLPALSNEPVTLSLPTSPRTPFRQCENIRTTEDANATWLLMKSKLNESINRYMTSDVVPGTMTTRSPRGMSPAPVREVGVEGTRGLRGGVREGVRGGVRGAGEALIEPDPARTSADSFL